MKTQKLYSYTRQAIEHYQMIAEHDVIAVGISGGKDCLTLLYALAGISKFYPKPFKLHAISVDLGFGMDYSEIKAYCEQLDVPYHIIETQIAEIVFDVRKESNPCSLCSNLRKGALNEEALKLGCNKVAYGHHRDDVIETLLLSLLYEGRINTFSPVTKLERSGLTLIRPLIYVSEGEIQSFAKHEQLPVLKNACPADGETKRDDIKHLLQTIYKDHPYAKRNLFAAIENDYFSGWS